MFETDLLPAQVFFLLNPKKISVAEVFSAILRDLTLRRIVNLQLINSFPNERSRKTQKYLMFTKGVNFDGYKPLKFEKYFLSPLEEVNQALTKSLTNYVLRRYGLPSSFVSDEIYQPLNKLGYVKAVPLMKGFGLFNLTSQGKNTANAAIEFINQQEEKLTQLIDGDKQEFVKTMNETGTYIFHFQHHNPDLYHEILSMVKRMFRLQPLGAENDLTNFFEAMNIDLSYFDEH